jgi:hypothetical protein
MQYLVLPNYGVRIFDCEALMIRSRSRRAIRVFAVVCLTSLISSWTAGEPVWAETGGFDCGRENHERLTEPSAVWFETYHRRLSLAHVLRKNGNTDLAEKFETCALTALRKAAEFGHAEAQYWLALRLHAMKPQTRSRQSEIYGWLRKAAAAGHTRAKVLVDGWPEAWGR